MVLGWLLTTGQQVSALSNHLPNLLPMIGLRLGTNGPHRLFLLLQRGPGHQLAPLIGQLSKTLHPVFHTIHMVT